MLLIQRLSLLLIFVSSSNVIQSVCFAEDPGAQLPAQSTPSSAPAQSDSVNGRTPRLKIGTAENLFDLGAESKMLAWEEWHARVGRALSRRVNRATKRALGTALITITVQRNHKVTAEVVTASNTQVGEACLSAARALDGEPVLTFPAESNRDAIAFRFQFKRGLFTIPGRHYIKDDYEKMGE